MDAKSLLYSTNYDKVYATNNILRTYELEYDDGTLEERLDLSDWRMTQILRRIQSVTSAKYNGIKKFTTICYLLYGNTTVYRIVLIFNGYMHPYEIPQGATLLFPDPTELLNAVTRVTADTSRAARTVIF